MQDNKKTIDFGAVYRCMLVGLDEATLRACRSAVRPLEAVHMKDMAEACTRISEVLPLVVALLDPAGRAKEAEMAKMPELLELAGACGAEIVEIALPLDEKVLGSQILEALRKGERRRVQKR